MLNVLMWLFGLPRRCGYDPGPPAGRVTGMLLLGMAVGTLVPFLVPEVLQLGFRPDQPFAAAGLPLVLSFFMHGGLLHVFGNAAFLILFGDEVEHELGGWRFASLIALSDLAGNLAETVLMGGDLPLVGASAGISGALAAYVVLFPWRELEVPTSWFLPLVFRGQFWLTMGVPWLLAIWLGDQLLGMYLVSGSIAFVAHLGGAAAGALLALRYRS